MANMETPEMPKVQRDKTKQDKKQTDELTGEELRLYTLQTIIKDSDEGSKNIRGTQTKSIPENKYNDRTDKQEKTGEQIQENM